MSFITGEAYTRDRIHASLGGEKVTYLPQKEGKIVCGCFSTDFNPEAPLVILVGGSDEDEDANTILKGQATTGPRRRHPRVLEARPE